jgi:O-antigen/teichoic acid export membrane protein
MLIILGKSVIEAWVGAKYVATSYPVLLLLLIPSTLMLAQSASGRTLWGMARHRTWAWVVLIEGIANLILSIVLVRRFGIIGDALGTAIPLTCTMVFFLPRHVIRLLDIPLKTYLSQAFLLPLTLCAPLVAVLLWMRHWFVAHTYFQLAIQLLIGSAVYGIGLLWAIWTHRAWKVDELSSEKQELERTLAVVQTYPEEA